MGVRTSATTSPGKRGTVIFSAIEAVTGSSRVPGARFIAKATRMPAGMPTTSSIGPPTRRIQQRPSRRATNQAGTTVRPRPSRGRAITVTCSPNTKRLAWSSGNWSNTSLAMRSSGSAWPQSAAALASTAWLERCVTVACRRRPSPVRTSASPVADQARNEVRATMRVAARGSGSRTGEGPGTRCAVRNPPRLCRMRPRTWNWRGSLK